MANHQGRSLLSQRAALIFLFASLAAVATGVLAVRSGMTPAAGALASGGAFAATAAFFNWVID
ncbi:hypothetical protein [Streptomyces demainii]|uniref:Uncharacterized protein n=1 Tax=Streptomyces demainii TaxID=588122 RepID=A0ABT9KWQ7_9ACTN|nr:hypothetical protein [Streptomyces demainii]MDP9612869.1 hypothetical protein [Streptomyces demainii]